MCPSKLILFESINRFKFSDLGFFHLKGQMYLDYANLSRTDKWILYRAPKL